jgi:hypothetical protein
VATSHKHTRARGRTHTHAHAHAHRRHRFVRVVVSAIGLLTVVGVSAAVVAHGASGPAVAQASGNGDLITEALSDAQVSRSAERAPMPNDAEAEKMVTGHKFVIETDAVDVYADADETSPVLAILAPGEKVDVTGKKQKGWTEIVHKSLPRWVKTSGLTDERELSNAPCPDGSGVESGLQPDTIKVYRAVCAKFPAIARWGGRSGGGDHATGRALDIMVGDTGLGDQIAAFLQKNRAELGIEYLIWQQRIWRPATSSSWRGMSDRGSPTANHMDHVHVSTYGNSATS